MLIPSIFPFLALSAANPLHPHLHKPKSNIKCPIILDDRISSNLTLQSFDTPQGSTPYNPDYVKGENRTWSSFLLFPSPKTIPSSRFDIPGRHKPLEVTIDNGSLFRAGDNLQIGFRRAGLLLKDDLNDAGADASDNGVVTFHWSVRQDPQRPLNLSHEYMNVWHEKADYSGNQFSFVGGVVLVGDGGTGVDTQRERESWKIQNAENEFVYRTPILRGEWQNFGVQWDYGRNTVKAYYSKGIEPLRAVTKALSSENSLRSEGQIYGGIFVEDSSDGCVSV